MTILLFCREALDYEESRPGASGNWGIGFPNFRTYSGREPLPASLTPWIELDSIDVQEPATGAAPARVRSTAASLGDIGGPCSSISGPGISGQWRLIFRQRHYL